MGVVRRQSVINTLLTYAGFGLGAINTLVLYTRFMSDAYFGLVGVVLSTGALLMPLLSFGVPNTLIKYFPAYAEGQDRNKLLSLMLMLPLLLVLPLGLFSLLAENAIGAFLARENEVVSGYVWHIFIVGLAMAYFEVFFTWSKVRLRSAFGTFMKEVFARLGVMIMLLALYLEWINETQFLMFLVALYLLRTLVMAVYAIGVQPVRLNMKFPHDSRDIIIYSALILLGGSVSVLLLEIDRFMINQYIPIENVAYYTVAVFIATVIIVPQRAMHQITYPLTAQLMHEQNLEGLRALYKKSSLSLLIVSLLVFLLILLNLGDLYVLLPESYRGSFWIIVLIGAARVYDSFLGINSAILYNSKYYRTLLVMGVVLAVLTILLNSWLIPVYGLEGAALATFLALSLYNTVKLFFVKATFKLVPWSRGTARVIGLAILTYFLFYWLGFPFHPLLAIAVKSGLIGLFFMGIILRLKLLPEIGGMLPKWLHKSGPREEDSSAGS